MTGGALCAALAAAESSSEWFRGGLVAYANDLKHAVLDVPEDQPVVSAGAAQAMGAGARTLFNADLSVAVTGVGGPQPQSGQEPGTVFLAVVDGSDAGSEPEHRWFDGDPAQVCAATVIAALELLVDRLRLPAVTSSGPVGSG